MDILQHLQDFIFMLMGLAAWPVCVVTSFIFIVSVLVAEWKIALRSFIIAFIAYLIIQL